MAHTGPPGGTAGEAGGAGTHGVWGCKDVNEVWSAGVLTGGAWAVAQGQAIDKAHQAQKNRVTTQSDLMP